MGKLFVSVHRVSLVQELLGALRKIYLVHAVDFSVQRIYVVGFLRDSEGLNSIFLAGFFLLEVALHLEGAIAALRHAEAVRLRLEAGGGGPRMMVHEGVRVGRLGAETRGHDQF